MGPVVSSMWGKLSGAIGSAQQNQPELSAFVNPKTKDRRPEESEARNPKCVGDHNAWLCEKNL